MGPPARSLALGDAEADEVVVLLGVEGLGLEDLVVVDCEGRALDDADASSEVLEEEVVLGAAEVGGVRLAPAGAELATRFTFCCCSCCFFSSSSCFRFAAACCRACCWAC